MKDVGVIYAQYIKNTELRATVQPPLFPLTKCCKVLAVACHLNDSTVSQLWLREGLAGWSTEERYRQRIWMDGWMDGWFFLTL